MKWLLTSLVATLLAPSAVAPPTLRCVIVGGGPRPQSNQVAIESNVRYVDSLLPKASERTILFADGKAETPSVQFLATPTEAEKVLRRFFGDGPRQARGEPFLQYRPSNIPRRDGATTQEIVSGLFDKLAKERGDASPLLVYFTGHGSPGRAPSRQSDPYEFNHFDLWGSGGLTPQSLAAELQKLPENRPVTVVMVQCFSGAFGNLLFENGAASGEAHRRPICGFFATVKEREAAGCTPEVEEEEYHDFTSYFFAALTGRDRLGRKVTPPDYNKDGKTGMDEAFAWTVVNEESIDVPVATSDVFLRRYVPVENDDEVVAVPWETVLEGASPAQKAMLEGLCEKLGKEAQAPDRLQVALRHVRQQWNQGMVPRSSQGTRVSRDLNERLDAARQKLIDRFPDLEARRQENTGERWKQAITDAIAYLKKNPEQLDELGRLRRELDTLSDADYKRDIADARWYRLMRIAKSVVLESRLRRSENAALKAQFERLKQLEAANPLR